MDDQDIQLTLPRTLLEKLERIARRRGISIPDMLIATLERIGQAVAAQFMYLQQPVAFHSTLVHCDCRRRVNIL